MKVVLTDIEGTTSALAFVREVLFPDSRARAGAWVRQNAGEPVLDEVRRVAGESAATVERVAALLILWIDEDRKVTALKEIQGRIWEAGYREGRLQSHVYDDVPAALRSWRERGLTLAVYSSGSIAAQRLFFEHTIAGDLSGLFDAWFDTTTGPKTAPASYEAIAAALGVVPSEILFLSDIVSELDAAWTTGMNTCLLARSGQANPGVHPVASSFADIHEY